MKKTGYFITILWILFFACHATSSQQKHKQAKRHPVGTINIATEIPGTLYIDDKPAKEMTVNHKIVITGMDTGTHSLSFMSDSLKTQREIIINPGKTDFYVIKPDTALLTSTKQSKVIYGSVRKIHSYFIPKEKGLYCLAKVGLSSGNGSSAFNGKIVAGYQFSPNFSLGAGTGYLKIYQSFDYFLFFVNRTSSAFSVTYLPVYLDIRINLLKKKVTPYFAADIGCSFPFIQETEGNWTVKSIFGGSHGTYHLNAIKPGWYFGITPGLKSYVYGQYYLDISFGWDICNNKIEGILPESTSSMMKTTSAFVINIGLGF